MRKIPALIKANAHRIFSVYIIIVLLLWTTPRLIPEEVIAAAAYKLDFPALEKFYKTQDIPKDPVKKFAPVLFLIFLFGISWKFKSVAAWFKGRLNNSVEKETTPNSIRNIWFTSFFIVLILLFKELLEPFYFIQDDNHAQFLPKILVGMGLLFQGEFPFIDNYHHFGTQLFEIGTYAYLDPLMLISYAFTRYGLHQPYATIEVYVILSMLVGAIFLGYCFRQLRIESFLSFSATVSFILAGFFFITTRNWYYTAGIACYLPILLYFFLKAINGSLGWRWFLTSGLLRGLFFYAGNAQFFIYALALEFLCYAFVFICGSRSKTLLLSYSCSVLLTAGLIFPLFISQLNLLKEIQREPEPLLFGFGIPLDAIASSLFPDLLNRSFSVETSSRNPFLVKNMYHIGLVWMLPFFIGLIAFLCLNSGKYKATLLLGAFVLLLSAGTVSIIYPLKYFIPILNKLYFAFKLFPFAAFVIILYSAVILSEFGNHPFLRKTLIPVLGTCVVLTILTSVAGTNAAFFTFSERPYPALNPGISKYVDKQNDILFGLAPMRYSGKPHVAALPHNYGCLYDLKTANYYDPLLPTKIPNEPVMLDDYFTRYGITKAVLLKIPSHQPQDWEYPQWKDVVHEIKQYPVIYEDEEIILYDTKKPAWIFKPAGSSKSLDSLQILEYDRVKIKAKISNNSSQRWEYHNEFKKGYSISINGTYGEIKSSPDGWCLFELPAGEHEIEIGYLPPVLKKGIMAGALLSVLSVSVFFIFRKKARNPLSSGNQA